MNVGSVACLNGKYLPARNAVVPAGDEAVLYGMGLFETIRVAGGRPRLTERHLCRLLSSAGELGLEVPFGAGEISEMIFRTAAENAMDTGALRLTLTAGGAAFRPSVFIQARTSPYGGDQYRNGILTGISAIRRNEKSPLVKHKTLNYFENILARREARSAGWDEAIFLNTSGNLAEGAVSNIFLVDRGKVVTPGPESGLLPGITRRRVIEALASMGIPVEERTVGPGELLKAGECFITNSLMGVMPVVRIGSTEIGNGRPGEIAGMIIDALEKE